MPSQLVSAEHAERLDVDGLLQRLGSGRQRLPSQAARERLSRFGPNALDPNALEEKKRSPLLRFLNCFWGPIPWMIEAAAILLILFAPIGQ